MGFGIIQNEWHRIESRAKTTKRFNLVIVFTIEKSKLYSFKINSRLPFSHPTDSIISLGKSSKLRLFRHIVKNVLLYLFLDF